MKALKVFGCKACPINIHGKSPTYDPKVLDPHIFVGMKGNRVWRLVNSHTMREIVSTDVKFDEYQFPKLSNTTNKAVKPIVPEASSSQHGLDEYQKESYSQIQ